MRMATWAVVIWTAVMALLGFALVALPFQGGDDYQVERQILAFLAGVSLFAVWLIGFISLSIIWFLSRPKQEVAVYGPQGRQMMVSAKEAKHWVEKEGWAYQPPRGYETAAIDWLNAQHRGPPPGGPPPGGQPPYGGPSPQPYQRDPTGIFYTPPGNEQGQACSNGCVGIVVFVAICILLAVTVEPVLGVIVFVIGFAWFWLHDR